MVARQDIPAYEQHIRAFLAARDTDVEAQTAVFNLDHAALDMISAMAAIALRPHDLTHAGFVMLMTLWMTGPRETRELAAVLRVTKGAVVGSVNTLEKRGLVTRERSDTDRRLVSVALTPEGDALITRVQKTWHALEREVTAVLSADEKRTLAALCRKVAHSARNVRRAHQGQRIPPMPEPDAFPRKTAKIQNELQPASTRR